MKSVIRTLIRIKLGHVEQFVLIMTLSFSSSVSSLWQKKALERSWPVDLRDVGKCLLAIQKQSHVIYHEHSWYRPKSLRIQKLQTKPAQRLKNCKSNKSMDLQSIKVHYCTYKNTQLFRTQICFG